MPTIIDLTTQVQDILPAANGGTGNASGYAREALFVVYANGTGGTLTRGTLVTVPDASGDGKLGKTTEANQLKVAGVIIGRISTTVGHEGELLDEDVDDAEFAAVQTDGRCWVDVEAAVAVGDFCYAANTDGKAKGQTYIDVGCIGIFEIAGTTRAFVRLFGSPGTPGMVGAIPCRLGDGVTALQIGTLADIVIPFNCTVTSVTLLAKDSGSVTVDIWVDTYANFPPANSDSITASATPAISSGVKYQDTTLTGWTTALTGGSTMRFYVEAASGITQVTCQLAVLRR